MNLILGIKLGRRLLAVAALDDERVVFHDCRYVSSRNHTSEAAIGEYFDRLLEQLKPAHIWYYAPTNTQTTTEQLASVLERHATTRGVPIQRLTKPDIFSSVGVKEVRTRRELRDQLVELCPPLSEGRLDHQIVLAEAAATAFVGDLREAFPT